MAVVISDHALVRWLERVHGIDLSAFRSAIAEITQGAADKGACGVVKDGHTYVIKNNTVVTVVPGRLSIIEDQHRHCRRLLTEASI